MSGRGDEVREFLMSRRARITPEQAGVVTWGAKRRVPGLRREEVAMLAGVSVDYYVRLERGALGGVSDSVLDAVAQSLQLDENERAHLRALVRGSSSSADSPVRAIVSRVRPALQQMLDAITAPAWIRNGRSDFLASNLLGRALYAPMFWSSSGQPNTARFVFLDPAARQFYSGWEQTAADMVAVLRAEAGRTPHDPQLTELIEELVEGSDVFRAGWAAHDVNEFRGGAKVLHHPVVGDLDLTWELMQLAGDPGLTMSIYSAAPGSPTVAALHRLESWACTDGSLDPRDSAASQGWGSAGC